MKTLEKRQMRKLLKELDMLSHQIQIRIEAMQALFRLLDEGEVEMYDPKCEELADVFLDEVPELRPRIKELAQVIQDSIEDWIVETSKDVDVELGGEPPDDDDPDRS